jgi:hypothetical protein
MTASIDPSTSAPADALAAVRDWRRETALRLGASDEVAVHLRDTGLIEVDGKPLSLQPMSDRPAGPWLATVRAARPAAVSEARWHDALLLASSQSLQVTHAAFGLGADGDAVVVLRVPPGHDDPSLLAAELAGLLALRRALQEGVQAVISPEDVMPEADGEASQGTAQAGPTAASGDAEAAACEQDFEAPEDVLVMVHGAMLHLGRTAEQALAVARSGSLQIDGLAIGLACDLDGENLVVSVELAPGVIDTPQQRRDALLANTELMAFVGMAVVEYQRKPQLMSRCHLPGQSAENFAGWLRDVARLARAIVERRTADANH